MCVRAIAVVHIVMGVFGHSACVTGVRGYVKNSLYAKKTTKKKQFLTPSLKVKFRGLFYHWLGIFLVG